ncbi:bacillithiol biosynthesis deacetylase BshB1 [Desulforamulus ruminis]|uniref:LmbE family protein n=1 Tax=Desulforamulus ruminis (strain ATCC 23193 / DSM 2154 / NCIMB 8452 / DL) TaxID=696281 RepID=F6DPN9_DESRL|nr:bacillithiol biosynthesis deacetylase BshB1 [Desulforamulus ruminis]AEG59616.1 LmbE family protein [Desulforamulus ruminis DSM 2154]
MDKVDVLAVGAHPDDVEVGAGGVLAKMIRLGAAAGIVDLTAGEMASNGTVAERRRESVEAADHLGLSWRKCLGLPDRGIEVNQENVAALVELIREARPQLVLCPYWEDRHPDHVQACRLVQEACFDAGLSQRTTSFPPFRPQAVWHYFLSRSPEPKFIVDISEVYEIKKAALLAHDSQFGAGRKRTGTFLNSGAGNLPALIESRDRYYGALIGAHYGEGFTLGTPLAVYNPLALLEVRN